jgi:hypothetical protein
MIGIVLTILLCIFSFILGAKYRKILFYLKLFKKNAKKDKKDEEEEVKGNIINNDDNKSANYDFDDADLKMVFLVREDLKLGTGKIAAQVAHAAVGNFNFI